jgi:two-component system invasion response regulator UvrY
MKKLLIASGHHITAFGLELLLKSKNADLEIQLVDNGSKALEQLAADADIQLLVTILDPNTIELGSQVLKAFPATRILAVTSNIGMANVQRMYSSGIKGVVDIANPAEIILHAVEEVLAGQTFMEEKFKNYLLQTPGSVTMSRSPFDVLTKREEEVIGLMLKGKKMGEISLSMNLKPSTISTFKTKIYEKLGVSSVLELKEVYAPQV